MKNYFNIEPNGAITYYRVCDSIVQDSVQLCDSVCTMTGCEPICIRYFEPIITGDTTYPITCAEQSADYLRKMIMQQIAEQVATKVDSMGLTYDENCSKIVDTTETVYDLGYHHYTLYYYDRAGNMIKTVPPAGVDENSTDRSQHPNHTMETRYWYNSLHQLIRQETPDGGETLFWHDDKGQLRFSQNAQQVLDGVYSFTKYDEFGRVIKVGVSDEDINDFFHHTENGLFPSSNNEANIAIHSARSTTTYIDGSAQENYQNRLSYNLTDIDGNLNTIDDQVTTTYSYDLQGNIEWLVKDIAGLGKNYFRYERDLLTGNITKVIYNENTKEQIIHKYSYDSDNRIAEVRTSKDGLIWDRGRSLCLYN